MATNSLHHHSHSLLKLQHFSSSSSSSDSTPPPSSLFLKPTTSTTTNINSPSLSLSLSLSINTATNSTTACSVSSTTTPSTSKTFSLDLLHQHLSNQNFRQADEESRRLLIALAGEAAQKRGYVFFSEVQFISVEDLKAIDELWRQYSDNRFGYSVQKRIWQQKADKDFTKFFLKVGWMKKLDTEVEQYNYKSFPNEFMWELNDDTPEGHLPLTNALRGTQLLNSILNHPAFESSEKEKQQQQQQQEQEQEQDSKAEDEVGDQNGGLKGLKDGPKSLSEGFFKPDYSF